MQLPNFLTDPDWLNIILVIATFVFGLILTVTIYRLQKPRKELSYEVITATPLLTYGTSMPQDFKVLYKGREIETPYLIEFRLWNSGNRPILSNDFASPLEIVLDGTRVFSADVVSTEPEDLGASVVVQNESLKLDPLLLNDGDSIRVRILTDSDPALKVRARIVGIRSITRVEQSPMDLGFIGELILSTVTISIPGGDFAVELFRKKATND